MAETSRVSKQGPPKWFVWPCKWFWEKRSLLWSAIILNLLLGILVTLLFTDPAGLAKLPIGWALQNSLLITLIFIVILALTIISWAGSQISVPPPTREVKRRYLTRMIRKTDHITLKGTLKGIPDRLIAESVPLDEVFIPIQLWANRPRTDHPLTDEALENLRYRSQSGADSDEERIIIEADKDWYQHFSQDQRITIADMWQRLKIDQPAAVIQGFPGMGKSTLMERLTLHMARSGLRLPDPDMPKPEPLQPSLIPILLRLSEYGDACTDAPNLSLEIYLMRTMQELGIPGVGEFIQHSLDNGQALIMLDGLDEVSDLDMRQQVQKAIRNFIQNYCDISTASYNRFLITSRVVGYDQQAFSYYPHFIIANLTDEQINYFLPRWCHATARRRQEADIGEADIGKVDKQLSELKATIQENKAVKELVVFPLLLTLLAVMQENRVSRPINFYRTVTLTLLSNRNIAKKPESISEKQAIQYLGPLAFAMQEGNTIVAHEQDVMDSLVGTIGGVGGTSEDTTQRAERFLQRVREQSGLFVQRTGDYFGFFQRTLQKYFAARYLLNMIEQDPTKGIEALVSRASRPNNQWREPILLAVAHQSNENKNKKIASDIIRVLLDNTNQDSREYNLLLAAECLIEAKLFSIEPPLEREIAQQLLQTYQVAQQGQRFQICYDIESVMRRWLLSPHCAVSSPRLLSVLQEAITKSSDTAQQRATLTLLSMIAQELEACPNLVVFNTLIPLLLTLACLPPIGTYTPATHISPSSNFDVVDLALSTLSFMGERGPAGSLLKDIRQYFQDYPEHLRLLARYSLESQTLLTFAVVPLRQENYLLYENAIGRWLKLRDNRNNRPATEKDIELCLAIQQDLLQCAEVVSYPTSLHLLQMLQTSASQPDQPWKALWQSYLSKQLASDQYIDYQECMLLWVMLFPEKQQNIVTLLLEHNRSGSPLLKRFAQRFVANLCLELGNLRDLRFLCFSRYLRLLQFLRGLRFLQYLQNLQALRYQQYLRDPRYLQDLRDLQKLPIIRGLRERLSKEFAEKALNTLSSVKVENVNLIDQADCLVILLERVLHIKHIYEESFEVKVELEIQAIMQVVCPTFTVASDETIKATAVDILRYLPLRAENEIAYALDSANQATDEQVQQAIAEALEDANPQTPAAKNVLEEGTKSPVEVVRKAVEQRLERLERSERLKRSEILT